MDLFIFHLQRDLAQDDGTIGMVLGFATIGSIAGAMLEKLTGTPWETLMTNRLFRPLRMSSAGFGPPGTLGQVDEPWGHIRTFGRNRPDQDDNPPAIGPAGTVHCSLDDLARYYDETIMRIRAAAPTASILILGPPDVGVREAGRSRKAKRS